MDMKEIQSGVHLMHTKRETDFHVEERINGQSFPRMHFLVQAGSMVVEVFTALKAFIAMPQQGQLCVQEDTFVGKVQKILKDARQELSVLQERRYH